MRGTLLLAVVLAGVGQVPTNRPFTTSPTSPSAGVTAPGSRPAAGEARAENLVTFDYRQAELRWIDQRWQLVAGGVWLKDFGRREADARAALRTIQTLHLTQRGTVGTPLPVMEYWLADGAAPQGFGGAGRMETLDLTSLRVDLADGQWCVRDNRHRLFAFGSHKDEAEQALAVIRRHGFTHLGAIGPAIPTMVYFLGGDGGLVRSPILRPAETKPATATARSTETGPDAASTAAAQSQQANATTPADVRSSHQPVTGVTDNPASQPERLPFDFRQVQVKHDQNEWKVVYGGHVFANFGLDQVTAQQALSLFQHYRFTEQVLIGRPPTFSYFLVAGQAPRGLKFGMPAEAFFPESVVVRQVANQWMVCEGDRPLASFGDKQDEARHLAQAIQRYRFDHLCRLGNGPGRSLTFLFRALILQR